MSETQTIELVSGDLRKEHSTARVFFMYVTPTGAELPLVKCPVLKKVVGRTEGGFEGGSRRTRAQYQVTAPTDIMLVNLNSQFGRPRKVANVVIHLSPDEPVIELMGLEGFGSFRGRGKIRKDEGRFLDNREYIKITDELLKREFKLKVLQSGRKKGGSLSRSLIF